MCGWVGGCVCVSVGVSASVCVHVCVKCMHMCVCVREKLQPSGPHNKLHA